MHAIRLKEPQPASEEMRRQFGITLLAPGIGTKIVKKNNSLVESTKLYLLLLKPIPEFLRIHFHLILYLVRVIVDMKRRFIARYIL